MENNKMDILLADPSFQKKFVGLNDAEIVSALSEIGIDAEVEILNESELDESELGNITGGAPIYSIWKLIKDGGRFIRIKMKTSGGEFGKYKL